MTQPLLFKQVLILIGYCLSSPVSAIGSTMENFLSVNGIGAHSESTGIWIFTDLRLLLQ